MPGFSYEDTAKILRSLAELQDHLILVGGQAVNFWAEQYMSRAPALAEFAPYTSNDIDFQSPRSVVERAGKLLRGTPRVSSSDETISAGTVVFVDPAGEKRTIDFLHALFGMDARDIVRTSIRIEVLDGSTPPFRVMQPVRCMESRVRNVMSLPGYQTKHAVEQMKASIICAREYMRELLALGKVRPVLKLTKRIYAFCHYHPDGRRVARTHGVDPFSAVPSEQAMPRLFRERGLPQMLTRLAARRERDARASRGPSSQPLPGRPEATESP